MSTLHTERLTIAYDRLPVVEQLDLTIPSGQITALIGPNGCGKSTLLRALARLLRPREGAVYLDHEAIAKLSTKDVARRMGILPQAPVAPEGLVVRELVAQGRYPHQSWFSQWSREDETKVERALSLTGLRELADRPLDTLSGGQRQKAWIAMALAQDTPVLLLDEPTTYLDMAYQVELLDLLAELNEHEGRTIVMVLHDINQACRYAHHLVAMRRGEVAASGDPRAILTERLVESVFGIHCRIMDDPVTGSPMCIPLSSRNRTPRFSAVHDTRDVPGSNHRLSARG